MHFSRTYANKNYQCMRALFHTDILHLALIGVFFAHTCKFSCRVLENFKLLQSESKWFKKTGLLIKVCLTVLVALGQNLIWTSLL